MALLHGDELYAGIAAVAIAEAELGGSEEAIADYITGWLARADQADGPGVDNVIAALRSSATDTDDMDRVGADLLARLTALEAAQHLRHILG